MCGVPRDSNLNLLPLIECLEPDSQLTDRVTLVPSEDDH